MAEPYIRPLSWFALAGLGLAVVAAVTVMLAGFGNQWGWWSFRTGFKMLAFGAYGGLAAAGLSLVGAVIARPGGSRTGLGLAGFGLVIGLIVVGIPWQLVRTARRAPPIHDITTDIQDPPAFRVLLPVRAATGATNSPDYGGPAIAAQQRAAYPTLGPLVLPMPPQQAFEQAQAAARVMGWEIVEANATEGRIEATDTTFWFGFKDDVVVRVAAAGPGSQVDVRSVSRVGRGDTGTNAKRIHAYLAKVRQQK